MYVSSTVVSTERITSWKLEMIEKEVIMLAYFKILFQYLIGRTEGNHKVSGIGHHGQNLNQASYEYR
jgi:hypothetical protein